MILCTIMTVPTRLRNGKCLKTYYMQRMKKVADPLKKTTSWVWVGFFFGLSEVFSFAISFTITFQSSVHTLGVNSLKLAVLGFLPLSLGH